MTLSNFFRIRSNLGRRSASLCVPVIAMLFGMTISQQARAGHPQAIRGATWYCVGFDALSPTNCGPSTPSIGYQQVPTAAILNYIYSQSGRPNNPGNCQYSISLYPWNDTGAEISTQSLAVTHDDEYYLLAFPAGGSCPPNEYLTVDRYTSYTCPPPFTIYGVATTYALCSGGVGISFFDPVADGLVSGSGLVSDTSQLAAATHTVSGSSADSATLVLVQIATPNAGDQVTLTLSDENGPSSDGNGAGYLTDSNGAGADSRASGGTIALTSVQISSNNYMAFAVYHVPTDFVRTDNSTDAQKVTRQLTVNAADLSAGISTSQPISIVRPPVVLIHGLWGGRGDFTKTDLLNTLVNSGVFDATTAIHFARYDDPVVVASSTPSYSSTSIKVSGNNLGFVYGAGKVLPQIKNAVAAYKLANPLNSPIAGTQADLVVHSMGGDVSRTLPQIAGFLDPNTYAKGFVHKLITIGTPHKGSPLANALLAPANQCVSSTLSDVKLFAFTSAIVNNSTISGAIGDLQHNSTAVGNIHTGSAIIPTAMTGGPMTAAQLNGAGSGLAHVITLLCSKAPLAQALTPTNWPPFMRTPDDAITGGASDGIVPLTSQFDDEPQYVTANMKNIGNGIHGHGANKLGFPDPTFFDQASGVPSIVLSLLNTPVSNGTVYEAKP